MDFKFCSDDSFVFLDGVECIRIAGILVVSEIVSLDLNILLAGVVVFRSLKRGAITLYSFKLEPYVLFFYSVQPLLIF